MRFTFRAVYNDYIALLTGLQRQFHMRRERRAAHAADACIADGGNNQGGADAFNAAQRVQFHPFFPEIVFDADNRHRILHKVGNFFNRRHFARHAGVHGNAQRPDGIGHHLADLDQIALLHTRLAGRANVHAHGQFYIVRHVFANRQNAGYAFSAVGKMYASFKCIFHFLRVLPRQHVLRNIVRHPVYAVGYGA